MLTHGLHAAVLRPQAAAHARMRKNRTARLRMTTSCTTSATLKTSTGIGTRTAPTARVHLSIDSGCLGISSRRCRLAVSLHRLRPGHIFHWAVFRWAVAKKLRYLIYPMMVSRQHDQTLHGSWVITFLKRTDLITWLSRPQASAPRHHSDPLKYNDLFRWFS